MMTTIRMLNLSRTQKDKERKIPTWLLEKEGDIALTIVTWVAHGNYQLKRPRTKIFQLQASHDSTAERSATSRV